MESRTINRNAIRAVAMAMLLVCGVVFTAASPAAAQATCLGRTVTVDIGAGQAPTTGNDVILGTAGPDTISAGKGDDIICGRGGNDIINGQLGNDVIDGGTGDDRIWGSWGDDTLNGGAGADRIWGKAGKDTINGQGGNDFLYGEDGADTLWGGWGNDTVNGGAGWDNLNGGGGHDLVNGGSGSDVANGNDGNDQIWGAEGDDKLNGGNGSDTIRGGSGADTINGDGGTDTLYGEGHDDVINGGWGNDQMYGGDGNDTIAGGGATDTANGGNGTDDCTAETEVACEEPPPTWIPGSEVWLESLSPFWFTISWCCTSGAELFEVTVIDSSGNRDPRTNSLSGFTTRDGRWVLEVDTFKNFALEVDEVYTVEIVAIGPGGRSDILGIGEISLPFIDQETRVDGSVSERNAVDGPSFLTSDDSLIVVEKDFSSTPCLTLDTILTVKKKRFWGDKLATFQAQSQVCNDGGVIDKNIATVVCVEGNSSGESVVAREPGTSVPNVENVVNEFGCSFSGGGALKVAVEVPLIFGEVVVERTQDVTVSVEFTTKHHLEARQSGICWTATSAPVSRADADIVGDGCPEETSHTG